MTIFNRTIAAVQRFLKKRNFVISRLPIPPRQPLNIIPLLVERIEVNEDDFCVVQIGANDGCHSDPIYPLLRTHRWRAILVEPQPDMFERLCRLHADRPNTHLENCAIASTDGSMTLYRFKADPRVPPHLHGMASFDRQMLMRQVKHHPGIQQFIVPINVPTQTVFTLLTKHHIDNIHLLQVDVEGFDFQILRMTFESGVFPCIIQFESWHLQPAEKEDCAELLTRHNYHFVTVGRDTVAALKSVLPQ
ncbi:MAG: FkbM family methyltransferase [Phycisphaeraceae bacterium]